MVAAWNVGLANENHSHLGAKIIAYNFGPCQGFS
jgi:hypothetical protein